MTEPLLPTAAVVCEAVRQSVANRVDGDCSLLLAKALNSLCARVGVVGAPFDRELADFAEACEEVLAEPAPTLLRSAAAMRPAFALFRSDVARSAAFRLVEAALMLALRDDLADLLPDSPEAAAAVNDVAAMVGGLCLIDRSIDIDISARLDLAMPDSTLVKRLAGASPVLGDRLVSAVEELTRGLAAASNLLSMGTRSWVPTMNDWPRIAGWPAAALAITATTSTASATAFMCVCKNATDADLLWLVNSPKASRADIIRFAVAAGVSNYTFAVATALVNHVAASRFKFPSVLI